MHYFSNDFFFGMHLFWWIFWIALVALVFGFFDPVPRHKTKANPLGILQRRYAAGEITTQEYEEHKKHLEQDGAKR